MKLDLDTIKFKVFVQNAKKEFDNLLAKLNLNITFSYYMHNHKEAVKFIDKLIGNGWDVDKALEKFQTIIQEVVTETTYH